MSTTTHTYTPITELRVTNPKIQISKCSAMLPNHLQCWRAADVQVVETTKLDPTAQRMRVYQLCNYHAALEQAQEAKEVKAAADLATAQTEENQTSVIAKEAGDEAEAKATADKAKAEAEVAAAANVPPIA